MNNKWKASHGNKKPEQPNTVADELCFGKHAVRAFLEEKPERCLVLYVSEGSHKRDELLTEILTTCKKERIPFKFVPRPFLDKTCPGCNHQGVVVKVAPVELSGMEKLEEQASEIQGPLLYLLLDRVQDPHNMGATIRSAEVFGAAGVIFPKWRSAMPTGTVLKTSSGAAGRIPLFSTGSVTDALRRLKRSGIWVFGLDHKAAIRIDGARLPERLALVVGSEGKGLTAPVRKSCDGTVKIPMRGTTGSLNVATAAAIGMYEWLRAVDNQTPGR